VRNSGDRTQLCLKPSIRFPGTICRRSHVGDGTASASWSIVGGFTVAGGAAPWQCYCRSEPPSRPVVLPDTDWRVIRGLRRWQVAMAAWGAEQDPTRRQLRELSCTGSPRHNSIIPHLDGFVTDTCLIQQHQLKHGYRNSTPSSFLTARSNLWKSKLLSNLLSEFD
jgi:hypothetical protein